MSNVDIGSVVSGASLAQHIPAGSFGAIQGKREPCGAMFSDLRHSAPRKLPRPSRLIREVQTSRALDELNVDLLGELFSFAARPCQHESRPAPGWLSRVLDKLRTEHCRRLTLDELAREAGVHPVHLSRIFRRFVGEGIGEHVHRLRVRTACERMLDPSASLAEVSFATGFADQSHFTRSFRRITGLTPAAFRSVLFHPT
jgi:AraC family transcriptional regulator